MFYDVEAETREYVKYNNFHFRFWDYLVFFAMIVISTGVGLYFGYFKRNTDEVADEDGERKTDLGSKEMNEYLLGSRKLKVFPVAMSLVASYVSGVTIMGTPSEIYNYGTQYFLIMVSIMFMAVAVSLVYLPVFAKLRVGSSYEYLEMRFSSSVRSITSIMFVLDEIFFLPIILYVPAIAFNQVTGMNIHIVTVVVCVACVLYTLLGGIKAVVHTDAWQILIMYLSMVVIVILGLIVAGGFGNVFDAAADGGRLIFFNFDPSPYQRHTFWSVLIGGFFYWTSFNAVNQTMVQRYMSLPNLKKGQLSVFIFTVGIVLFLSTCCFAGLLIYEFYKNCDPKSAGLIDDVDQLLPLYVMQTVGHLPGVPGLFIAGVFGAALSSLSVVLNSTALVFLEDIVKGCFKIKLSARWSSILVHAAILILGVVALSLVFVLDMLSGILGVATSLTAIAAGTSFGLFTLGMLVPWANNKGAIVGAICGALLSGWISLGSQVVSAAGLYHPQQLNVSVSECPGNVTLPEHNDYDESIFPLYRLSFHWINPIGVLTTVLVGTLVSFLTGPTKLKELDASLISPVMHGFLPPECFPSNSVTADTQLLAKAAKKHNR